MVKKVRRVSLTLIGAAISMVLLAGSASAATIWTDSLGFEDLGYLGYDPGYDTVTYSHAFTPSSVSPGDAVSVQAVELRILLTDDLNCVYWYQCRNDLINEGEWAVIQLDGTETIFDGEVVTEVWGVTIPVILVVNDVTVFADIQAYGDGFDVTVRSVDGDLVVLSSKAEFTYTTDVGGTTGGGGTAPIPEPSAALVFGVGLLVISRKLRRRA